MLKKDNRNPSDYQDFTLRDLINIQEWQKIQDNLSAVTEVGLRLLGPDASPLTSYSRQPRLCFEVMNNSPVKENICGTGSCLPTFLQGKAVVDKNLSYFCEVGLHNFIAPIMARNARILGYVIVGPVILVMRKPKEEYSRIAQELGLNLEDFWDALLEIRTISFHCALSLVELFRDMVEYTIKSAYQNKIKPRGRESEIGLGALAKFSDVLLDAAFEISKADIGSVMFLDKTNNELTIFASRGIAEDIIRTSRVKSGSGVSGIALEEARALLIDTSTQDNRLKPYLSRPQIACSMVIPLKLKNEVVGVMNIAALKDSEVRFNQDNLNAMRGLADLVNAAVNF